MNKVFGVSSPGSCFKKRSPVSVQARYATRTYHHIRVFGGLRLVLTPEDLSR